MYIIADSSNVVLLIETFENSYKLHYLLYYLMKKMCKCMSIEN
jgi:hypothetical protein